MRALVLALMGALLASCATTGDPPDKAHPWWDRTEAQAAANAAGYQACVAMCDAQQDLCSTERQALREAQARQVREENSRTDTPIDDGRPVAPNERVLAAGIGLENCLCRCHAGCSTERYASGAIDCP